MINVIGFISGVLLTAILLLIKACDDESRGMIEQTYYDPIISVDSMKNVAWHNGWSRADVFERYNRVLKVGLNEKEQ